jgi:hypothetical protein
LIPVEDQAASYFLEPVGIFDPSEFIAAESQRIPFKISLTKPHEWQDTFKNWPLPPIAIMITDLKVTGTVYPYKYKGSSKQIGVKTGVGYTTRKVAICDDLLVTLLTFVTEWYVLYDEFSNFVIGGK